MEKREYKCTAATKEALLDAILQLSKSKEYEKITIREICSYAKISIGSFYHHFHSKEDLAIEAYYQVDKLINEDFKELCKQKRSEEKLHIILKSYIEYVAKEIGILIKTYYKLIIEQKGVSAFEPERLYYKTLVSILEECSRDGIIKKELDPKETTQYCLRFLRGLIFDWSLHDGTYDLLERFEFDYQYLLNGLKS